MVMVMDHGGTEMIAIVISSNLNQTDDGQDSDI